MASAFVKLGVALLFVLTGLWRPWCTRRIAPRCESAASTSSTAKAVSLLWELTGAWVQGSWSPLALPV
eukprot:2416679-Pyramimonas_sp.AAC.1